MIQPTTEPSDHSHELSRSLKGRHLTMISIGGIIGAGLFVSSTAILRSGPAAFISDAITGLLILLVMRMLGEMTMALPKVRSFTEFARRPGRRRRVRDRLAVLVFLGAGGCRSRRLPAPRTGW